MNGGILFLGLLSCNSKFNIEKLEHSVTIQQDSLVIQVEISTAILKVFVKSDGTIEYQTKDNHKLVSETNEFTYIKSGDAEENKVSQAFVAGDEILYGLGQFQSGIMNWKNVPICLEQYNQEIAIPFLLSRSSFLVWRC